MEEIALGIKVNVGEGKRTVADLRNEMRTLTEEVQNTERGTDAYAKAIQRLGETKAELKDLKEDIAALDPDAKAKAFIGLGQTMVAGFTAAQGAAALFGSENEDIQKGILKMQAAIGVLHGIQAAADAADQVGRLKIIALQQIQVLETKKQIVATEGATIAQRIWNLVMSANPIGLLITGVVALTAAVAAYTLATKKSADEQDRHNKLLEESRKKIIPAHNESLKKRLSVYTDVTKQEIAILEAKEASETEIFNKKKELIKQELTILDYAFKYKGNLNAEEQKQKRQLNTDLELLEIEHGKKMAEIYALNEEKRKNSKLEYLDHIRGEGDIEIKVRDDISQSIYNKTHESSDAREKREAEAANKIIDYHTMEMMAKVDIAQNTISALGALGDLAINNEKKRVEFQKKIAIAQIALDTAISVAKAIRDGNKIGVTPVDKAVYIASNIALILGAFARVKGILQQANVSGGSGVGGGSSPSTSSSTIGQAPRQSSFQRPNEAPKPEGFTPTSNTGGMQRVYVVESDITNTQNRVKTIESLSTF